MHCSAKKALAMLFRIFALFLLLLLPCLAEEAPLLVKGQFHGKVKEMTFEHPFEVRLEPGEKSEQSVELEGVELQLGVLPKWHYSGSEQPDGILLNFYLKCRGEGLKIQRTSSVLVAPGGKASLDLNDKEAEQVFTLEVEANSAPKE